MNAAPRIELIQVTPETAREWLGFNTRNRSLRPRITAAYAADMKAGDWQVNGDAIKFAADGRLLDGQHRLAAVIEAGVTVPVLVARGLPDEAQDTYDAGFKRSFSDALGLRGEAYAKDLAAITRRVTIWQQTGTVQGRTNMLPTNAQQFRTLEQVPSLREITKAASYVADHCDLTASVAGLCMWLFLGLPDAADDVTFFFDRLGDFQGLSAGDPVYELRRALERARSERRHRSETQLTGLTIKAWNLYRRGEQSPSPLTFRMGGGRPEAIPEPQ
jgi:hypothetical protein